VPEIPYGGVTGNETTDDELWAHGLSMEEADDVWDGPAKYFNQAARDRPGETAGRRRQPARMVMIGPDLSGRLLTFILEERDENLVSHVVTGWPSDREDQARYRQPGGRIRQS
jgi:uncharacterized DUF497 family protein